MRGHWHVAVIQPTGRREGTWALPKGLVDPGERPEEAAVREVAEETGVLGRVVTKVGDVRYTYIWEGERVFKIVSFYLLRYVRGRLGALPPGMDVEVAEARWLPLEEAPRVLSYRGEKEMVTKALAVLSGHDL